MGTDGKLTILNRNQLLISLSIGCGASGAHGIKIPQRLLGVTVDGIVGPKTLAAVNARNPRELFDMIKIARFDFIEDICRSRPANNKFKRGWMNRINDLRFEE